MNQTNVKTKICPWKKPTLCEEPFINDVRQRRGVNLLCDGRALRYGLSVHYRGGGGQDQKTEYFVWNREPFINANPWISEVSGVGCEVSCFFRTLPNRERNRARSYYYLVLNQVVGIWIANILITNFYLFTILMNSRQLRKPWPE